MGWRLPRRKGTPTRSGNQARKAKAACVETLRLPSGGRGRFEFAIRGGSALQFAGGSAVVNDQVQEEHKHEDTAEGDHDGGADAGNDQVTEDQQNAGDSHGRRHDKTERSVEKEVPEADVEA